VGKIYKLLPGKSLEGINWDSKNFKDYLTPTSNKRNPLFPIEKEREKRKTWYLASIVFLSFFC
jgi:hypothetical protein